MSFRPVQATLSDEGLNGLHAHLRNETAEERERIERAVRAGLSGSDGSHSTPWTGDQRRAIDEILSDLGRDVPMLRLLQGDVGDRKSVV